MVFHVMIEGCDLLISRLISTHFASIISVPSSRCTRGSLCVLLDHIVRRFVCFAATDTAHLPVIATARFPCLIRILAVITFVEVGAFAIGSHADEDTGCIGSKDTRRYGIRTAVGKGNIAACTGLRCCGHADGAAGQGFSMVMVLFADRYTLFALSLLALLCASPFQLPEMLISPPTIMVPAT